ncbi:MAG: hypothetical protein PHV35_07960, partial [Mariniphaga sp.]|nr:hypothetical protein [Mariniphaga sp.]
IIRWKFDASAKTGPFDLFWYDGGMRPPTPPEMEADNKELESEGMMFVGDKGKIIGGFRCENPVIIPESKMMQVTGAKTVQLSGEQRIDATEAWIDAILNKKQSPGSILTSGSIIETAHLAAVALRTGRKIMYDHKNMKVTNIPEANKLLYRSEYRKGWEI